MVFFNISESQNSEFWVFWGKKKKQNQRTALSGWFHKPQGPCGFHERTNEQQFCGWLFEFFKFLKNHD